MYCSHWFITIFAYTLPFDHLLRVWDIFLLEGIKIVFRCAAELPWDCLSVRMLLIVLSRGSGLCSLQVGIGTCIVRKRLREGAWLSPASHERMLFTQHMHK